MAKHRELANIVYAATLGHTSASKIWRTVVFAGAMLGAPACGGGGKGPTATTTPSPTPTTESSSEQVTPATTETKTETMPQAAPEGAAAKPAANPCGGTTAANPCAAPANPCAGIADPCAGGESAQKADPKKKPTKRPRTNEKARPTGRGFILS